MEGTWQLHRMHLLIGQRTKVRRAALARSHQGQLVASSDAVSQREDAAEMCPSTHNAVTERTFLLIVAYAAMLIAHTVAS